MHYTYSISALVLEREDSDCFLSTAILFSLISAVTSYLTAKQEVN
jgi:hypothetical protein